MQVLENVLGELDFARVTREHPTLVFRPVLDQDLGDLRETIEVLDRVSGVHHVPRVPSSPSEFPPSDKCQVTSVK
jgi:hypothetical protein